MKYSLKNEIIIGNFIFKVQQLKFEKNIKSRKCVVNYVCFNKIIGIAFLFFSFGRKKMF